MAKSNWRFGMDELVYRDVVRKYLDPKFEWLSKISSREYHRWKIAFLNLHRDDNLTEVQKDEKIREEIELMEERYQLFKKQWKENRRRNRELDISINNKLDLIHDLVAAPSNPDAVLKNNDLTKKIARDMGYGNIVRSDKFEPVTASTKLTRHDKKHIPVGYRKLYKEDMRNKNGRIYPKEWKSVWHDRSHKNLDWMCGEISHPSPYSLR